MIAFSLRLGSVTWRLAAAPELEEWARRFARILGLQAVEDVRLSTEKIEENIMVFLPDRGNDGREIPEFEMLSAIADLPRLGWTVVPMFHLKLWRHPHAPVVVLRIPPAMSEDERILSMSEACLPFYVQAIENGGLPLHAALLSRNGEAVALAAPGGTGKSTCARRIPPPWQALGDDLALVSRLRSDRSPYWAQPFPTWSDYVFKRREGVWKVEEGRPLRAVFFLSQSDEDRIVRMGQGEAAIHLSQSGHQILSVPTRSIPIQEMRLLRVRMFENASSLARSLPVFRLEATLSGSFWREIERLL